MSVAGRKPKPAGQARNRMVSAIDWTIVPDRPFRGGPRLPAREPAWSDRTRRWWRVVSAMPHCVLWTEADWQFALDTAEAHARFVAGETQGTELRIREKLLGTTLDSRRDLRIRYVPAGAAELEDQDEAAGRASVVNLDDFRDL